MADVSDQDPTGGATIDCVSCRSELPRDATFCLRCGVRQPSKTVVTARFPVVPEESQRFGALTGVIEEPSAAAETFAKDLSAKVPSEPAVADFVPVRSAQRTMMGMSAEEFQQIAATAAAQSPQSHQNPMAQSVALAAGATMHGLVAPPAQPAQPAQAFPGVSVPGSNVPPPTSGSTMMGVAIRQAPAEAQAPSRGPLAVAAAGPFPPSSGTIQGVSPATSPRPRREAPPMMGGTVPGVPPGTPAPIAEALRAPVGHPPSTPVAAPLRSHRPAENTLDDDIQVPGLPARRKSRTSTAASSRSSGVVYGLMALLAVVLAVAGVFAMKRRPGRVEIVPATVRAAPSGLIVSLRVPGAARGSRLRYGSTEVMVGADGAVEFSVTDLADRVGTIDLPIEVLSGTDKPRALAARIFIGYRINPNFQHLGDEVLTILLEFRIPNGASLWVAEQPIRVVGDRGIAQIPAPSPISVSALDPSSRNRYPIRVRTLEGTELRGEYELRVPRASLRVDSPSPVSIASGATVTVRGRSPNATRVLLGTLSPGGALLGGTPATLTPEGFSATVSLAQGRNTVDVVAYASNNAPAYAPLVIYRGVTVQSYLGSAPRGVESVLGDNPPQGVRLRVTGVVVQRSVVGAEPGVFQIAVDDPRCPSGRCGVLVSPLVPIAVTAGARVDVVGETSGVRSYTTAANERRTVALVTALFVTVR